MRQLVQLAEWTDEFDALGVAVVAMTYDDVDVIAKFHREKGLDYPLLSDRGAANVNAWGIRNEAYAEGHDAYGVAHPGIAYVDAQGVLRAKFAEPGYAKRPAFDAVYAAVRDLIAGAQ